MKNETGFHIHIDKDLKARMKSQLAKEGKTFKQVVEELFEKYLEDKDE